jgi:hypothetical protein
MDFLDPKKRRSRNIRLLVGYCLVAIALLLASTLLLFAASGYGINRSTGEVTQNGLVFVDAHPEQATMFLNGQDKGGTDGRFVLEAGIYNLELKRDNYRTWKRDFVLEGGNIVRLVYPFLFPEILTNRNVYAFTATPDMVTSSPDRKWIVSHTPAAPTTFQLTDTSTDELTTTTFTIPQAILGTRAGEQRMKAVEWSTDNRHLLVHYTFAGGSDYLIIDRQEPEQSISVSQTINSPFVAVTLRDKKSDQLYIQQSVGGQLVAANTKDGTTAIVATGVVEYWPYKDNTVLYATTDGASPEKALIKLKDGQITYNLREVATGPKYLLNIAEFDGDTYVVAGSTADGKTYVYKNPLATLKKDSANPPIQMALLRVDNPSQAIFSSNTRFIALQGGSKFAVYDFETKNQYKYDINLTVEPDYKATWMDGHRLMLVSGGKMNVFDYDNQNRQGLVDTSSAYVPMFDRDFNQLFTVGPLPSDSTKTGLIRTDLNLGTE